MSLAPSPRRAVAASLLALAACTQVSRAQLAHPLTHGGALARNQLTLVETDRAQYLRLPDDTFTQQATVTALDATRACFDLTLRVDGARAQLARLAGWRVSLRANGFESTEPAFGPEPAITSTTLMGSVEQHVMQTTVSCTPGGACSPSGGGVTVRVPAAITVLTGGGTVCFRHDGAITPATRALALELHDPAMTPHRLEFRWDLVP